MTLRRAALRNTGGLDRKEPDSIVDAEVARLFGRKCNQTAEVMEENPNRTCRNVFGIFMSSLWDVSLRLLYEELQAYRRPVKRNSAFGDAPLSDLMDADGELPAHLREFRDSVLHPESRTLTPS